MAAQQRTSRNPPSNYTKVALTWPDDSALAPICPSLRRLAKQKRHRLWLLCDFTVPAGHDGFWSLGGPTSHMTLPGCEDAVLAWMLNLGISSSVIKVCHHSPHIWNEFTLRVEVVTWPRHHFQNIKDGLMWDDVPTRPGCWKWKQWFHFQFTAYLWIFCLDFDHKILAGLNANWSSWWTGRVHKAIAWGLIFHFSIMWLKPLIQ